MSRGVNADRNRNQIGENERNSTQHYGYGYSFFELFENRPMIADRVTKIERDDSLEPLPILDRYRLIQSIKSAGFTDDLLRDSLTLHRLLPIAQSHLSWIARCELND